MTLLKKKPIRRKKLPTQTNRKKPRQHEDADCKALWAWIQYDSLLREYLYHIPNGGSRNVAEAAKFKSMGVRAGVSDYHLPLPRGRYHGLWIEMKATPPNDADVTKEQKKWQTMMRANGYAAYVCLGWLQANRVLKWYLGLHSPDVCLDQPDIEDIFV